MNTTNKNIFSGLIEKKNKKTDKPANKYRKDEASHLSWIFRWKSDVI